jgi:hypothetical protein
MRSLRVAIVIFGCACVPPAFDGHQTDDWLAFDLGVPGRDPHEVLRQFAMSAHTLGCGTEPSATRGGRGQVNPQPGVAPYSVTAYCEDGRVALIADADAAVQRVTVGCAKPTTREQCEALLRKITDVGR